MQYIIDLSFICIDLTDAFIYRVRLEYLIYFTFGLIQLFIMIVKDLKLLKRFRFVDLIVQTI